MSPLAVLASTWALASIPMNGDAPGGLYHRSSGVGTRVVVPQNVAHPGEYFEVYSPNISTVYSQVFWTRMADTPLPPDIVARFKGKTMAITGYECDSTRMLPDGTEEHVPIYEQYNHHHAAWVVGDGATMIDLGHTAHNSGRTHHGGRWTVVDKPLTSTEKEAKNHGLKAAPKSAYLVDGNGGEYRMTLHGTHQGTAMLVDSPSTFQIVPMMINTKHPEGKPPGEWDLIPSGSYGRSRGATPPTNAQGEPSSLYSPMLECPCTDRKVKVITQHDTLESGHCPVGLTTAQSCFSAAYALGLNPFLSNKTVSSTASPTGCFITATKAGYEVSFNIVNSTTECGAGAPKTGVRSTGANALVGVDVSLDVDGSAGNCTTVSSDLSGDWECKNSFGCPAGNPYAVQISAVVNKPGFYNIVSMQGGSPMKGIGQEVNDTIVFGSFSGSMAGWPSANISDNFTTWSFNNGVVWTRPSEACQGLATITLTGPSDVWFGTGFDARSMADAYAIIVDGMGNVSERQLGNGAGIAGQHQPGSLLTPSVTVVSNTVISGRRTVVMTRALQGKTAAHATFTTDGGTGVPIIAAVGSGPTLSYHRMRATANLMLVEVGAPMCLCEGFGSSTGTIDGVPFSNVCPKALANDHQGLAPSNDVCDITTYEGGLKCCHHESILLDKNQTVPNITDTYRMKFRVYFEEYTNQSEAFFMFQAIDAGGEYQVPQAKPGTPLEERVHTVSQDFTVGDTLGGAKPPTPSTDVLLLRASTHCHAPACINETLYNLDTNEVICFNAPLWGAGDFPADGQSFNEPNYAAGIPPCFWGDESQGLPAPPRLSLKTNLRSVKHCNSTYYHYGVMAQWQMRGTWAV